MPPLLVEGFGDVEPVYEEMPGWKGTTFGVTDEADIGLYFKRMQALSSICGDAEHHLGRFMRG